MDEFKKLSGPDRNVQVLDLAILLYHVYKGAADKEVGFEDCRETLESLTRRLNKKVSIDPVLFESALWSSNMMAEQGKFWHPTLTFDEWVKQLMKKDKYNRRYSVVERKEANE